MSINKKLGLWAVLAFAGSALAGPYDGVYNSFKVYAVNPTTATTAIAAQSNFPLLVRLTTADSAHGRDVIKQSLNNGLDVRFTDSTGNTPLGFERVRWTGTTNPQDSADFWVRLPQINGTGLTTKIRIYYGKSGAADTSSSTTVFDTTTTSGPGFRAVWHMENTTGNDELDATANG